MDCVEKRSRLSLPFSNNLDFLQIKQKDQMPRTFNQKIELENELEEIQPENSFFFDLTYLPNYS